MAQSDNKQKKTSINVIDEEEIFCKVRKRQIEKDYSTTHQEKK